MSDDLRTVATFITLIEADMARNRLEEAGIRAFLAAENRYSPTASGEETVEKVARRVGGRLHQGRRGDQDSYQLRPCRVYGPPST